MYYVSYAVGITSTVYIYKSIGWSVGFQFTIESRRLCIPIHSTCSTSPNKFILRSIVHYQVYTSVFLLSEVFYYCAKIVKLNFALFSAHRILDRYWVCRLICSYLNSFSIYVSTKTILATSQKFIY